MDRLKALLSAERILETAVALFFLLGAVQLFVCAAKDRLGWDIPSPFVCQTLACERLSGLEQEECDERRDDLRREIEYERRLPN